MEVEYVRLFYVSYCITDPLTNLSSLRNDKIWYGQVSRESKALFSNREKANGEDMVERWIPLCENIGYNTIITH